MSKKKISLVDVADQLLQPQASTDAQTNTATAVPTTEDRDDYSAEQWYLIEYLNTFLTKEESMAAIDYGFYEYKNRYWMMRKGEKFISVSNFVIKAKYLITGSNPRRIVEIINTRHKRVTLDLDIKDLISVDAFKFRVESTGDFLYEGTATDLGRIKSRLFRSEKEAVEIARLGWHNDGFFAWANGIYHDGQFKPIDDNGMVTINGTHYYIPILADTKANDDEDLRNYRRFAHQPADINLASWSTQFVDVYGENGIMGIAFSMYALFSDIVCGRHKLGAPMAFFFGQRGSGKGTMANSLLYLWGTPQDPLMLGGASTVVGFMRKLGQFVNGITWLDEYKNDIGEKKIESLKNIWDRIGYERGVKDNSTKTVTTPVTSSAIISGQEMPNAEPALFSRCVLFDFKTMQHEQHAIDRFNALRKMEETGITAVTLEMLSHRDHVKEYFFKYYNEIAATLRAAFLNQGIIERQIVNYSIMVAMVRLFNERVSLPFTWQQVLQMSERYMQRQNTMMGSANEVQQFFEMVAYLLGAGHIIDGKDIHVSVDTVKIRMVTVFPQYRDHSRRQGVRCLDKGTMANYLQNCPAYVENESKRSSHRFPKLNSPTSAVVFLRADIELLYNVRFNEMAEVSENQTDTPSDDQENPF